MLKKGDLVEILNLSSYQMESMASQQCIRIEDAILRVKAIIGMKYYIECVEENRVELLGWNHGGGFLYFSQSQLKLVNEI